jgi:hypothetical protein
MGTEGVKRYGSLLVIGGENLPESNGQQRRFSPANSRPGTWGYRCPAKASKDLSQSIFAEVWLHRRVWLPYEPRFQRARDVGFPA